MDILIHFASGKTKRIYGLDQELSEILSDSNHIIFDNCFVNIDYVELIETNEIAKEEGNENE